MILYKDLEKKLEASLCSNRVQEEVISTLDWYRNQLMVKTRELNELKGQEMTTYTPDRWVVLKITTPTEVLYKVLASWYGGYIGSDSWKLSSGTMSLKEDTHVLELLQYSGSSYICYKNSYGMSSYARSVLANWQSTLDPKLRQIEVLPEDFDLASLTFE